MRFGFWVLGGGCQIQHAQRSHIFYKSYISIREVKLETNFREPHIFGLQIRKKILVYGGHGFWRFLSHEVRIGAIQFPVTNLQGLSYSPLRPLSDSSRTSLRFLSNFQDPTCFGLQISSSLLQLQAKGLRQGGMCGHTLGIKAILLEVIIESNVPSTRNS